MSKCLACDCFLTDFESTRKSAGTGEYLDICNSCFASISDEVLTIDREDLLTDIDGYDSEVLLPDFD